MITHMVLIRNDLRIVCIVYIFYTRQESIVEQELLTRPEHMSSPPVFGGVSVTRSLVLYVLFCRSLFVLPIQYNILSLTILNEILVRV